MRFFLIGCFLSVLLALAQGELLYKARCAVCHGIQGQGTPGLYPPLAGSLARLLALEEARSYLTWVVAYGLSGPIRSGGVIYNGVMPAHPDLSPEDEATLLNHLLTLNARPKSLLHFTSEEVKRYRAVQKTPVELNKLREALMKKLSEKGLPLP